MIPNPGSDEALEQGCKCAVIDNGHGKGMYGGVVRAPESGLPLFVVNGDCPLHGLMDWRGE